jgi:HNH endonuclease/AP2 domain
MHSPEYRRIPLVRKDGSERASALVDADVYTELVRLSWFFNKGYAASSCKDGDRFRVKLMHREVLGLEWGDRRHTDHINRDRLDNRRANLRVVSLEENTQNRPSQKGSSSRFRGVSWNKAKRRWTAQVVSDGRYHRLGAYINEIDAAIAAEAFRRAHMPFAEPDPELTAALEVA